MYFIFGSKSSRDYDLLVILDQLGTLTENKETAREWEQRLSQTYSDKPLNVNLGVSDNGQLTHVYKGTVDEVNNSIIDTYGYHSQAFPLTITQRLTRDVDLKIIRSLRVLLSLISRTEHREAVKKALRASCVEKHACLMNIDFSKITSLDNGKNVRFDDYLKTLAFQLGQTLGLIEGIELYSKEDLGVVYPELNRFLQRETDDLQKIEQFKQRFLSAFAPEKVIYQFEK